MNLSKRNKQFKDLKDNPESRESIRQAKKNRSPKKTMPMKGKVILFGLAFLGVGVGSLLYGLSCWTTYLDSRTWERVPVSIHSLELEKFYPESGTAWKVKAVYSYSVNGITYKNNRVDIIEGGSNDYDLHVTHYNILKQAQQTEQNYPAYVNPKNPREAVLFRDKGNFMLILPLFGLVFALAGGGILLDFVSDLVKKNRFKKKLEQTPDTPWLAFDTWKNNRTIHSQLKYALVFLGVGLLAGLFLSIGLAVFIIMKEIFIAYIMVGFLILLDFIVLIYGGYKLLQYLKWGKTCFTFDKVPFRPGEKLKGMIVNPKKIDSFIWFKACLLCSQDETVINLSGKSIKTRVERRDLYEKEFLITGDKQDRKGGTSIRIDIDIPTGFPGTSEPAWDEYSVTTYWQFEITAETPGIDFKETFDLPIFS